MFSDPDPIIHKKLYKSVTNKDIRHYCGYNFTANYILVGIWLKYIIFE